MPGKPHLAPRQQPIAIKVNFNALAYFARAAKTLVTKAATRATLSVKAVPAQPTARRLRLLKLKNCIGIDCAIDTDTVFSNHYFQ
jgi:hypothetical protein